MANYIILARLGIFGFFYSIRFHNCMTSIYEVIGKIIFCEMFVKICDRERCCGL